MPVIAYGQDAWLTDVLDAVAARVAAESGLPLAEAKIVALRRAARELSEAAEVATPTDAAIDRQASEAAAEAARLKALRPTGEL